MNFGDVLNCVGRDFSREWGQLHSVLVAEAVSVRDDRPRSIGTLQVQAMAEDVIARWRNRSQDAGQIWTKVLLGDSSQRELQGFCFYGYCAALHRSLLAHGSDSKDLQEQLKQCAAWDSGAWWPWNFLTESRWSKVLNPLDLLRVHGSATAQSSTGLWAGRQTERSSLAADRRLAEDRYLPSYRSQMREALRYLQLPGTFARGTRTSAGKSQKPLVLAAFGVHFTTLLEPITSLRRVLPPELPMVAVFYGSSHPPPEQIVHEVCPEEPGWRPNSLLCLLSASPKVEFWQTLVDAPRLSEALTRLSAIVSSDENIRGADCLICGGGQSPTLCFLLRMVISIPMYFTLQAPLSFRMPRDPDKRALMVAFFKEMASPTMASTSSLFLQRQVWVQTGCLIPIVRNHNWYAGGVPDEREPTELQKSREILFWQNHIALKPDCSMVVWRFMKQSVNEGFPFNFVFKNIRNLHGIGKGRKVYALTGSESAMLSFGAIRKRFVGAVAFPHDLGMFSFDDLYALGVPLFMPSDELIVSAAFAQLASTKNYPWYLLREEHADLRAARADTDAPLPWDPGWGGLAALSGSGRETWIGRDSLDLTKLQDAVATTTFTLYPHIRRFESLSGLLKDLQGLDVTDLLETSAAMRHAAAEAWKVTADFYRQVAKQLMGIELESPSTDVV